MDGNLAESKCSLFIRGIPSTTTNEELLSFFSEIGPIRACFIANSKTNSEPSNKFVYGFVRFVTSEDAQRALDQLKDVKFKKSKLRIEMALKKVVSKDPSLKQKRSIITKPESMEVSKIVEPILIPIPMPALVPTPMPVPVPIPTLTPKSTSTSKVTVKPKSRAHSKKTDNNSKCICVTGLPDNITKKQLFKKLRKFGNISALEFPVNEKTSECNFTNFICSRFSNVCYSKRIIRCYNSHHRSYF